MKGYFPSASLSAARSFLALVVGLASIAAAFPCNSAQSLPPVTLPTCDPHEPGRLCRLFGEFTQVVQRANAQALFQQEIAAPTYPAPHLKAGQPVPFYLRLDGRLYPLDTSLTPFLFTRLGSIIAPGAQMTDCRRSDGQPQVVSQWIFFYQPSLRLVYQVASASLNYPRTPGGLYVFEVRTVPGNIVCTGETFPANSDDRIFYDGLEG